MKEKQRGLHTSQTRPASSGLRTRGSYYASLTRVRSNSPRHRSCALGKRTDSVVTIICKFHVAWPVCCGPGRNSFLRIKVSARDVGDGDRGTEAGWGRVPKGRDFATKKVRSGGVLLPSFRRPRNSPRAGASSRVKGVGISTRHFRKPDSTAQHVKAHCSAPGRRPSCKPGGLLNSLNALPGPAATRDLAKSGLLSSV